MADRKIFAGPQVRRLRQTLGITQAAMAKDLDISASYLNLVERNQRPLTAQLLLKLAEVYDLDLRDLSGEREARLAGEMTEALTDPLFPSPLPPSAEIMEMAAGAPAMAEAFLTLYRAYRRTSGGEAHPGSALIAGEGMQAADDERFPIEEVSDYFHARANFIAELDDAAEELSALLTRSEELWTALRLHLRERHGIRVSVVPVHTMPDTLRRFDRHSRRLFLSELLPLPSRIFQTAVQVALEDHGVRIGALIADAPFRTEDARRLCQIGLANYFAGALMLPYHAFHEAAGRLRYDIALLASRFGASIEQVAHRLTTLQRPDRRGIPFFLLRVDNAGNISKRFTAGGFHFARFGGTCPRWRVYDAFATPGHMIVQPVEMPDGLVYLTISRTLDPLPVPYPQTPRKLAISLGCPIGHAADIVYGDGLDLTAPAAITPIGVTCRVCARPNCPARAFPSMIRPLVIDASRKKLSAFEFG